MNDDPTPTSPTAVRKRWVQPLTFGGVAGFATAPPRWLASYGALVAALLAAAAVLLFYHAWAPAITLAIDRLPPRLELVRGTLNWPASNVSVLSDNTFLALVLNPERQPVQGQTADLQLEFRTWGISFSSLLGTLEVAYPADWDGSVARDDLLVLWSTWRPYLAAGVGVLVLSLAVLFWCVLALGLAPVEMTLGWLISRCPSFWGAFRTAWGAQLPGTLVLCVAIVCYSLKRLSLVELLLLAGLHCAVSLIYLLVSPLHFPRSKPDPGVSVPGETSANPFSATSDPNQHGSGKNPFR